jgi:hypothetical protein
MGYPSIAGSEGTDQMKSTEINEQGHHLALAASLRVLARHVALAVNPSHADEWFTELGQDVFDYVDRTTHPTNHPSETRAIKEAAYDTLRMVFDDPKGLGK